MIFVLFSSIMLNVNEQAAPFKWQSTQAIFIFTTTQLTFPQESVTVIIWAD